MRTYQLSSKCFPVEGKGDVKKNWLKNKQFYIGVTNMGNRYMIKVSSFNDKTVNYFMDIITGSLYTTNGVCLSSSQIVATKFHALNKDSKTLLSDIINNLKQEEVWRKNLFQDGMTHNGPTSQQDQQTS